MPGCRTPVPGSLVALAVLSTLASALPEAAYASPKPSLPAKPHVAPAPLSTRRVSPSPRPTPKQSCVPPKASEPVPFGVGELLEFEIDSVGARVGTFSMHLSPERPERSKRAGKSGQADEAWRITAKAKTDTFASNFYEVSARARATLGPRLESRAYEEDAVEKGIHRTLDITLPVPPNGTLPVRATREGTPRNFQVNAPRETRDLLSALHAARAMPLAVGDEVCLPIFGGHRVWTLRMKVVGREPVDTPAGSFQTLHLEGSASLLNNPKYSREVHLWFSDDDARLPVAAFGQIQGKPVRAQLVRWEQGKRRVADARRR